MSSQSIREPGAVCQNTIGPAVLAVCAVKDPLSEPFPGPPLGRVGLGIAPQGGLVGKLKQIYVFHFCTRPFSLISGVRMCRVPARVPRCLSQPHNQVTSLHSVRCHVGGSVQRVLHGDRHVRSTLEDVPYWRLYVS